MQTTQHQITSENIKSMNYPDFVALMKQDNTPPGSAYTLDYWIEHGGITNTSFLLDLACSTGYSSRYCHEKVKSRAEGIDISDLAIKNAQEKALLLCADKSLHYQVADACNLPFESSLFTHVLGGCNFAFIQNRQAALDDVIRVMKKGGIICTSNFYYRKKPSQNIIDDVYNAIGFRPDPAWSLQYWTDFFDCGELTLIHEKNHELNAQSTSVLRESILDYIRNGNTFTCSLDTKTQNAFYERFLSIREPLNAQRDYQGVTIQLWRKK
ncbi:class I SAM-dependent methyltransferase [Pectobacterium odoriferum]|uniref:class I SAM-dependent methyltransferase n=1 Tax=Pectobacterium odoriferum TaxID=78398 RepID=UPI000CD03BB0|nr:class I SAM-dependent methyltransferase [Pectobacterium odoriferum]POD99285.1 SAM-dependent methyltransferase [Pectobacterium odoriferum]